MLGLIGQKIGMTRCFDEKGASVPLTVLLCIDSVVVDKRTQVKNGYDALILASKKVKINKLNKPLAGFFNKANLGDAYAKLKEFRCEDSEKYDIGQHIGVDLFSAGEKVDVQGKSIGKGFAGAMKRHGFHGLRASHGVSISHRSHGSTGQREYPGRVFKNKRMAGHMGHVTTTQQNLLVWKIDPSRGLIYVKGSVPGAENSIVYVKKAIKKVGK